MSHDLWTPTDALALDGDWAFTYTPELDDADRPTLPDPSAFSATMPVPGFWDDHLDRLRAEPFWSDARFNPDYWPVAYPLGTQPPDAELPFLLGVGWYRRRFTAPAAGRVALRVGEPFLEAWVWLNGRLLGHHLGHSTGFELALDEALKPGEENELHLAIANTRTDRIGCIIRGWKGRSGGLMGGVALHVSGGGRIRDCYVQPVSAGSQLDWQVDVDAPGDGGARTLRWAVEDGAGGEVVHEGEQPVESGGLVRWRSEASGMVFWSDREPKLYRLRVRLEEGGKLSDERVQPFGLRWLGRAAMQLRLNDRPIFLRGATEHAYYPKTCTAPDEASFYRELIRRLKSWGFNWLRFHTWVPPEPYLQAADELGMLIQVEPPAGFTEDEWLSIVRMCRRHPSVVIYCAGNEELLDEAKLDQLERMAGQCHEMAPDAMFNPQEALRGVEYGWAPENLEPGAVDEPYRHNPRRLERLKTFSDCFGAYNWGMLSYRSVHGDWRLIDERLEAYERPCLSHEITIHGSYLDLDLAHRYEGTRIGPGMYEAARAQLAKAGVLDRAARYYENSCAWMRALRKQALETARKCRRLSGYDMLGATDHHWHRCGYPCGVANEFGELKPGETAEDVRRYNGESVLLLDRDRAWNFRAGERFESDLLVSLFGPEDVESAEASWALCDEAGHVYQRGSAAVGLLRTGGVSSLMRIAFDMPATRQAKRLELRVRLAGEGVEVDNRWQVWVYPEAVFGPAAWEASLAQRWGERARSAGSDDAVRVLSELDESTIEALSGGARVLLLGHRPFPGCQTLFQSSVAGRALGNVATCIEDHWITRRLAHGGYCDWDFYPMLEEGQAVVFNDLPIPFEPIIEVVSTYKTLFKQAALFELRVGEGRLLVCSLNLTPGDAASEHLLSVMLAYAHSEAFQPAVAVETSTLQSVARMRQEHRMQAGTDEGFDRRGQVERS